MLGLAEHVGCDDPGIGFAVADDEDLARTGYHIDSHDSGDLPLGLGHEDVSGTHDLVRLGNGFRSISQGCDGLGSAHAEDPVDPGHIGCGKHSLAYLSVLARGADHDYLPHARKLCGDGVHEDRRGIGGRPARDIDARDGHRYDLLAEHNAIGLLDFKTLADLVGVSSDF